MRIEANIDDFEKWLRERGYDERLGKDGLEALKTLGFSSLLFNNSPLLISFILSKLGLPSERVNERVRFEVAKRIESIVADKHRLVVVIKRNV